MNVARVCLDINVFYADLRGRANRVAPRPSASSRLAEMAQSGQSDPQSGLGFQLIISAPMLEQWANVLQRHFTYTRVDAEQQSALLGEMARQGPLQAPPLIVVGSDFVPFATEEETRLEAARLAAQNAALSEGAAKKLFDEIQDDRHVLLAALAGGADLLATTNLADFKSPKAICFEREDVIAVPTASRPLVVARPSFAAYWLGQGVIPNWAFIEAHPSDFAPPSAPGSGRRGGG